MTTSTKSAPHAPLPFLGMACAVGVSTMYYNQPLLLEMSHTYGATARTHRLRRRRHSGRLRIGNTRVRSARRCAGAPWANDANVCRRGDCAAARRPRTSINLLIAGSVLIGMFASVTHVALPIAPDLVSHEQRGKGHRDRDDRLLLGILLARTFSGWVSGIHGWRWVFVVAAVMNAAFVPLIKRVMPKLAAQAEVALQRRYQIALDALPYATAVAGVSLIGALVFASFSCFWTTLAFLLHSHYGTGCGALPAPLAWSGAAGALVARSAGRLADKHGSRWVVSVGMSLLAASYLLLWGEEAAHLSTFFHVAALGRRGHRVGHGCADDPGRQPDADLRSGAFSAQPPEHRLHDRLLQWRRSRVRARDRRVGALGLERCLRACSWVIALAGIVHATGHRNAEDRSKVTLEDVYMEA